MNSVTCDLEMFILKRACLVCISGLFEPFPSEGTLTRKNGKVRCSLLLVKTITIIIGSNTVPQNAVYALGSVSVLSVVWSYRNEGEYVVRFRRSIEAAFMASRYYNIVVASHVAC